MTLCVPYDQCSCGTSDFYEGDKKATTTYYTSSESQGIGSCGGCVYPACPNCGGGDATHSYQNMFTALEKVSSPYPWTMAASAESMMGPSCPGVVGMGCTGRDSPSGQTANAPCGSCWQLTNNDGKKINVVITDACPYKDNPQWCPEHPGEKNPSDAYNHFDVWNGQLLPDWGQNPRVTFQNIPCPQDVRDIIKQGCCGTYYYDETTGRGQGCPEICGSQFSCPNAQMIFPSTPLRKTNV